MRAKARKVRGTINGTGGDPAIRPLTPIEEKVVEIMGSAAIYGFTTREYLRFVSIGNTYNYL